jgi:hypothetical protein
MPSKERVRHARGRAIPGGKGPLGLQAWGADGLYRVVVWIRLLRREHTVSGLSALTGVSEGSIRNMCDGGREPTPEMAGKIAAAVGADLSFIVKGRVA